MASATTTDMLRMSELDLEGIFIAQGTVKRLMRHLGLQGECSDKVVRTATSDRKYAGP